MSTGMLNKFKSWVTGDPFEDDIYAMEEDFEFSDANRYAPMGEPAHEPRREPAPRKEAQRNLRVVGQPQPASSSQVVVIEPQGFEEALDIVEHLRSKKSIILNLHLLDTAQSQRVVDFLAGATHALDGHQHRIGDGVFLFTPNHVMITADAGAKNLSLADSYWGATR